MSNTWSTGVWGQNEWGDQGPIVFTPTGVSATSSVGSVVAAQLITAELTGVSATSSLGSLTLDLTSVVSPTGVSLTTELGSFDNAGTLVGWGRNGWGEEPYGDSFNKLEQPAGLSITSSVGSLTAAIENFIPITGVSATSNIGSLGFVIDSKPAIACWTSSKFVFVLVPHVPAFSPVAISSSLRSDEYVDAIILYYTLFKLPYQLLSKC